jgi:hypothetical protein
LQGERKRDKEIAIVKQVHEIASLRSQEQIPLTRLVRDRSLGTLSLKGRGLPGPHFARSQSLMMMV